MDKEKILGWTPYIELFIRKMYYSENAFLEKIISKLKSGNSKQDLCEQDVVDCSGEIYKYVKELNIQKGDILIVHSSKEALDKLKINSIELISVLLDIVGEEGTLVLPAFPLYNEKNYREDKECYEYNPKRTLCSTGMLPNLFLRMKGVMRSEFPWNSLAAKGYWAEKMMEHEFDTDLAHGKGSAWHFCYENHAKILLLGVKSSHTTTMVHVAEDILDDKWPIRNWYEKKKVVITSANEEREYVFRIRKQEWAKYNASWYRSNQLKKQGILYETNVKGLDVGFIDDSKALVDYIVERNKVHKGFFVVPKRFYI